MDIGVSEGRQDGRREQLQQAFAQEPATPAGNRRERLHEAFAKPQAPTRTREQLSHDLEHDTPDRPHREMDRGHGIG